MNTDMSIRDWVKAREVRGLVTFSYEDVISNFSRLSPQVINNNLSRLIAQKIIANVYRGFYVVIPPHYAERGVVPEPYYIEHLMKHLGKPYYVALLNAAQFYGAAHQKPQYFSVVTTFPQINKSKTNNDTLYFIFRNDIPKELLRKRNSETGSITFSSPELTAVDLVQYYKRIGGLSRAATVIAELEDLDFEKVSDTLFDYSSISAIQRLGYILEFITDNTTEAEKLYARLITRKPILSSVPLSTIDKLDSQKVNNRWKVIVNMEIEIDDL